MENKQTRERKASSSSAAAKRGTKNQPQQPLKVVHISNPMKLKTSPSNFRSIVQELTGRHAVWPVDPSKFSSHLIIAHNQTPPNSSINDFSVAAAAHLSTSPSNNTDIRKNIGTAVPTPDVSAGTSHPCFQPLDQDAYGDDHVVLIDHPMLHYMLHDHQDFAGFVQSGAGDSRKN